MPRITKYSLKELAKENAALEAAETTILSTEEMERYSGGRYGAYTSLSTSKNVHGVHALAGLEDDMLSKEVENSTPRARISSLGVCNYSMKGDTNNGCFNFPGGIPSYRFVNFEVESIDTLLTKNCAREEKLTKPQDGICY
jgi:hypothetical protein